MTVASLVSLLQVHKDTLAFFSPKYADNSTFNRPRAMRLNWPFHPSQITLPAWDMDTNYSRCIDLVDSQMRSETYRACSPASWVFCLCLWVGLMSLVSHLKKNHKNSTNCKPTFSQHDNVTDRLMTTTTQIDWWTDWGLMAIWAQIGYIVSLKSTLALKN